MAPYVPDTGALIADDTRPGRYLRVSGHPEFGRVVVSIWQDDCCVGTVRLDESAVADLIAGLAQCLAAPPDVADASTRCELRTIPTAG